MRSRQRYVSKRGPLAAGRRLGCQTKLFGDVVVDVPADSQVHRQVVRKSATVRTIAIEPVVTLHYVDVREPDMHDPSSDFRRLQEALEEQWTIKGVTAPLETLRLLQKSLREGKWSVTAAIRHGREIVGIWPGLHEQAVGLAVDIGSTTIAAHLCDLKTGEVLASSGVMNPQIRFGEDVMSRVSYVMMNPGGDVELTASVREAIGELAVAVTREVGLASDDILDMTVVANPIMHHLFLGLDPTELGGAPFALAIDGAYEARASAFGLPLSSGAYVYVLPCIAGHVGADTAGVVLSEGPYLNGEMALVVDVGTNAEIVLGNRDRLLACSSPTGPAFEGGQISSGQRAAPGAIERVRIDKATLEPRFKVIGSDIWSDEPGFAEASAGSGVTGICGSGIIEAVAEMLLAGLITPDGVVDGAMAAWTPRIESDGRTFRYLVRDGEPRIAITQNDIRAIQLGKAALYAGTRLLMDRYGVTTVDRITLAGAFGSHIDVTHAMVLGLVPDCDLLKVSSAGNAAGTGAQDRASQRGRTQGDRGGRPPDRKGRDGDRACLPGAFRRRDGDPAQERRLPSPRGRPGSNLQARGIRRGWRGSRRARATPGACGRRVESMKFASDNWAGASPRVREAIVAASHGFAKAYGLDETSAALTARLGQLFEREVAVFLVPTGTAANALSLGALCPPYGSILAHEEAHVIGDEYGAPEFFTQGARLVGIAGVGGKLTPDAVTATLTRLAASGPRVAVASALSITQATECGTVYRPDEVAALASLAKAAGWRCTWTVHASPMRSRLFAARRPRRHGRRGSMSSPSGPARTAR